MNTKIYMLTAIVTCIGLLFTGLSASASQIQTNKTLSINGFIQQTSPTPTPTPAPPSLIPPDGYCYTGAYIQHSNPTITTQNTINEISNFTALTGKGIYLKNLADETMNWGQSLWVYVGDQYWGANYTQIMQTGIIKAIQINLWPCLQNQPNDTTTIQQIAQGTQDTYIHSIAQEAKTFGYPIYLRFGPEMNINQGSQYEGGGYSYASNPQTFIAAWQRTVNIFRSDGATNVQFVWCANWEDFGPNHWTAYYPGDSYVDWVGIDLYQSWQTADPNTQMAVYNDYASAKPVAICEWGANWVGQNFPDAARASYINKFFDAIEARPQIKMIMYQYGIDFVFDATHNPLTTAAYRNRIANPRYITNI